MASDHNQAIDTIDSLIKDTLTGDKSQPTSQKPKYEFDTLKMYFGDPYLLTKNVVIYQPTIGDIIRIGEKRFYSNLNIFISHTTQYKLPLWKAGIDWNKLEDFELFCSLLSTTDAEASSLLFGNVNLHNLRVYEIPLTPEEIAENEAHKDEKKYKKIKPTRFLQDKEQDIIITKETYERMAEYIRTMFNIFPKVQKARGKSTKETLIFEEEMNLKNASENPPKSTLLPLISSCVNHPGFKYKLQELRDVGICEFMDSVRRLQIYESAKALNSGRFAMCDLSEIDSKLFDFMRDSSN